MNQPVFGEHSAADVADIQEKARNEAYSKKYLGHLPIKKDELVLVRFIDTEPLTFYQHYVKDPVLNEGKGAFRNLTCSRDGCPVCAAKTQWSKPRWVGAYRVIHLDDPAGPRMRVFSKGVIALTLLEKKQRRLKEEGRDINQSDCEIDRSGEGMKTIYTFEFKQPTPAVEAYEYPENIDLVEFFKIDMESLVRIAQTMGPSTVPASSVANKATSPAVLGGAAPASPPATAPATPPATPPAAAPAAAPGQAATTPPNTGPGQMAAPSPGATPPGATPPAPNANPDSGTGEDPPF